MSHNTGPFPNQSNAALPNMARGNFPNQNASQHAVQPPAQHPVQHPTPLNSNPFLGAPGHGAGTGAHSGPHPMVNGNVNGNFNGNFNGNAGGYMSGDDSWISTAHQAISNAIQSSGFVVNTPIERPPMPMPMILAPHHEFGPHYEHTPPHYPRDPPNSPAEGFAHLMGGQATMNGVPQGQTPEVNGVLLGGPVGQPTGLLSPPLRNSEMALYTGVPNNGGQVNGHVNHSHSNSGHSNVGLSNGVLPINGAPANGLTNGLAHPSFAESGLPNGVPSNNVPANGLTHGLPNGVATNSGFPNAGFATNGITNNGITNHGIINHGPTMGRFANGLTVPMGRLPQSQSYTAGLTQSNSQNSGLSLMSPGDTPHEITAPRARVPYSSPLMNGRLTEPRNYAPRTSGLPVQNLPPPRFNLNLESMPVVSENAVQESSQDPFTSPAPSDATSLIPFPNLPPPTIQLAMLDSAQLDRAMEMALIKANAPKSDMLRRLTGTYTGFPTLHMALNMNFFPFMDGPSSAKPVTYGVIRLKNIPFSTKRAEVVAFIGRSSKMLNDADEPVHIIMDRATSKTMDAFVEFQTMEDAIRCAERHHLFAQTGRVSRLGDRPIEVELSSQAALMRELYPLARGVFWDGATPNILPPCAREPWGNFKGFISCEEMVMLVKHVEVPHRSPFSKECPQRPYECLISTLGKFPWFATDFITIAQRGAMYKASFKLIRLLLGAVSRNDDPVNLNHQLFRRLVASVMKCKGFTTLQKDNIAFLVHMGQAEMRMYHQPEKASSWVHQYSVTAKPGVPQDVLDWYIRIIREQSTRDVLVRPISERTAIQEILKETDDYWGYFFQEVGYAQGPSFDFMTLKQCAIMEFSAIERLLTRALGRL
ncbi:hypothetical protein CEP52_012340 [Fusarium oligoseptatum]|uniref:RRM domain-containing protein n=1 Tax=Fusarium oligoseptatum TaxID=2604345 RepID=A0A428SYS7_9HYPO|nr:hypothetical protein CEP52_012340 [Fusarium oligoseptatum]